MKRDTNTSGDAGDLRRRAEQRLAERPLKPGVAATAAEMHQIVHELQVYKIELEMQNEELRRARAEVEAVLERYVELYDFAPAGYLTLDLGGRFNRST